MACHHLSECHLFALLPLSNFIGTQTRHLLVYRCCNLSPHDTASYSIYMTVFWFIRTETTHAHARIRYLEGLKTVFSYYQVAAPDMNRSIITYRFCI
jgi:hypothetical protein